MADFADKNDSDTTEGIIAQTVDNLKNSDLQVEEVLADTGYSSGVSYRYLEKQGITAYIPPISGYKPVRDGFKYDPKEDYYVCHQGKKLLFKRIKTEKGRKTSSREYRTTADDCRDCPFKVECCKKGRYKQLSHSVDKSHYDKAYRLLNTSEGKQKMRLRGRTVEPVWGTLLHFRRLKKVYTKGNDLANKQVLMAAATYNLKKLMGFKSIKSAANVIKSIAADLKTSVENQILLFLDQILLYLNDNRRKCIKMMYYEYR
jgi:hypothetical protein